MEEEVFDTRRLPGSIFLPPPTPISGLSRNQSFRNRLSPTRASRHIVSFAPSVPYPQLQAILGDSAVSLSQKDLAQRVVNAAESVKKWLDTVEGWHWKDSFATIGKDPEQLERGRQIDQNYQQQDEDEYWGCLPSAVVEDYEDQLDDMHAGLVDLEVDELKERILSIHQGNSRPSSSASTFSVGRLERLARLDEFTFFVTKTLLKFLPELSRLNKHMRTWSTRLTVLHIVPFFLEKLRFIQARSKLLWVELNATVLPDESAEFEEARLDDLRESINDQVAKAGQLLDSMLDVLEGHEDRLPDQWIDDFEVVEADLGKWSMATEQKIFHLKTRQNPIHVDKVDPVQPVEPSVDTLRHMDEEFKNTEDHSDTASVAQLQSVTRALDKLEEDPVDNGHDILSNTPAMEFLPIKKAPDEIHKEKDIVTNTIGDATVVTAVQLAITPANETHREYSILIDVVSNSTASPEPSKSREVDNNLRHNDFRDTVHNDTPQTDDIPERGTPNAQPITNSTNNQLPVVKIIPAESASEKAGLKQAIQQPLVQEHTVEDIRSMTSTTTDMTLIVEPPPIAAISAVSRASETAIVKDMPSNIIQGAALPKDMPSNAEFATAAPLDPSLVSNSRSIDPPIVPIQQQEVVEEQASLPGDEMIDMPQDETLVSKSIAGILNVYESSVSTPAIATIPQQELVGTAWSPFPLMTIPRVVDPPSLPTQPNAVVEARELFLDDAKIVLPHKEAPIPKSVPENLDVQDSSMSEPEKATASEQEPVETPSSSPMNNSQDVDPPHLPIQTEEFVAEQASLHDNDNIVSTHNEGPVPRFMAKNLDLPDSSISEPAIAAPPEMNLVQSASLPANVEEEIVTKVESRLPTSTPDVDSLVEPYPPQVHDSVVTIIKAAPSLSNATHIVAALEPKTNIQNQPVVSNDANPSAVTSTPSAFESGRGDAATQPPHTHIMDQAEELDAPVLHLDTTNQHASPPHLVLSHATQYGLNSSETQQLGVMGEYETNNRNSSSTISEGLQSFGNLSSSCPSPTLNPTVESCLTQPSSPILPNIHDDQVPIGLKKEQVVSQPATPKQMQDLSPPQSRTIEIAIVPSTPPIENLTTSLKSYDGSSLPTIDPSASFDSLQPGQTTWDITNSTSTPQDDTIVYHSVERSGFETPKSSSTTEQYPSMLSAISGTSVALDFDDDSDLDNVIDTPSRPAARLPKPPLNALMKKRRGKSPLPTIMTISDEALFEAESPDRPIPTIEKHTPISSPISPVVPLQQQISSILDAIPTPIRLKSGSAANAPEVKRNRARTPSFNQARRPLTQPLLPTFTLAPADDGPRRNNSKEPDITIYHLIQTGRDKPIKLFIRRVGENGERVMVRVGGGWADLGEYLRSYAEHHGHRNISEGRVEIQPIASHANQTRSRTSSLLNGRSTPTGRNTPSGRATPVPLDHPYPSSSRPGSALGSSALSFSDTPPTNASGTSQRSVTWNEAGLAGPFAKRAEMSGEKKEWIEGIVEQAKKSMGKKVEVGDLGKSGATRRIFFRGRSETPNGGDE